MFSGNNSRLNYLDLFRALHLLLVILIVQRLDLVARISALYKNSLLLLLLLKRDNFPVKERELPTSAFLTGNQLKKPNISQLPASNNISNFKPKPKPFCPFCDSKDHFLNGCEKFKALSKEDIGKWIRENKRCWKCCRKHKPDECTLKRPCHTCQEIHLTILHEASQQHTSVYMVKPDSQPVYVDKPSRPCDVMLKVVRVHLHGPAGVIDTYAVLDDGSERTMLLEQAAYWSTAAQPSG